MACLDHVQVECAEKVNMRGEDFPRVSLKFTHEHVAFIRLLQRFKVISKLLCPRSGVSVKFGCLSIPACPNIAAYTCWWERRRSAILLAQLTRRMMSSIAIGTIPSFGVPLCSEFVLFFFCSLSHFLLVIAKSRRFYSVLGQIFIFLLTFHAGPHKRRNPQTAHPAQLP